MAQGRKSAAQVVNLKEAPLSFVAGIIECRTWNTSVYIAEEQFSINADYFKAHVLNLPSYGMIHVGLSSRPPQGSQPMCPGFGIGLPSMSFASRTGELLSGSTVLRCGPTFSKGDTIGVMIRFDHEAVDSKNRKGVSARRRGTEVPIDHDMEGLRVVFLKNDRVVFQEPLVLPEEMTSLQQASLCPCIGFSGPGAKVKISELDTISTPAFSQIGGFKLTRNLALENGMVLNTSHSDDHEGGVQLSIPFTPENNFYELTVMSFDNRCEITVGVAEPNQSLDKQPAVAFRSENSSITNVVKKLQTEVVNQGRAVVRGDCVGCGIYFPEKSSEAPAPEQPQVNSFTKSKSSDEEAPRRGSSGRQGRSRPTLLKRTSGFLPAEMEAAADKRKANPKKAHTVGFKTGDSVGLVDVQEGFEETEESDNAGQLADGNMSTKDNFARRQTRRSMADVRDGHRGRGPSVAMKGGFNPNEVGSVKRGEVFWTLNDVVIGSTPVTFENNKLWCPYIRLGAGTSIRFNPVVVPQHPDHCTPQFREVNPKLVNLNRAEMAKRFGNCLTHGCNFNGRMLQSVEDKEPCGCLFMKPLSMENPFFEIVLSSKSPISVGLCVPLPEFEQHPPKKHVGKFQQSVGFWVHNGAVWVGSEAVPYQTEVRCQVGDIIRVGGVFSASGDFGHAVYFACNGEIFGEFTVLLDENSLCPTIVMTEPRGEIELRFPKPLEDVMRGRLSRMTTSNRTTCNRSTLARRTVKKSVKELEDIVAQHEAAIRAEQEAQEESIAEADLRQRKEKAKDFRSNFAEAMDAVHGMQAVADEDTSMSVGNAGSLKMLNEARQKEKFAAIRRCSLNNSVKYGLSPFVHRKSLQVYEAFVPDFNFDFENKEEDSAPSKVLDKEKVVALVNRKSLEPHALQGALQMLLNPTNAKKEIEPETDLNEGFAENAGKTESVEPDKGSTTGSLPQVSPKRASVGKLSFGKRAIDSAFNPPQRGSLKSKPGAIRRNQPPQRSVLARAAEGAMTHR